jgi:hypothetical protein
VSDETPGVESGEPIAKIITRSAADIEPKNVEWLWRPRIALGKANLLAGAPGMGKSMVTVDLAARVSRGAEWPVDGGHAPVGSVLFIADEDGAEDTIVPRLIAAEAVRERVHIQEHVADTSAAGDAMERWLNLQADLRLLGEKIAELGDCKLVIIDPISAYLGGVDDHRNADLRAILGPLAKLAEKHHTAILAVTHFSKRSGSANDRVIGSVAYTAAVRSSMYVVKDPDEPKRRLLLPGKNNIGPDDLGGLAFTVQQNAIGQPYIVWEPDAVTITADEAMDALQAEQTSALEEAMGFLRDYLAKGPVPSEDVTKAAHKVGISQRTLERARAKIPVHSYSQEFQGTWVMSLKPKPANDSQGENDGGHCDVGGHCERTNNAQFKMTDSQDAGLKELNQTDSNPKVRQKDKVRQDIALEKDGGECEWSITL